MKNKILSILAAAAVVLGSFAANAAAPAAGNAANKPVSKVSDVHNMPDDSIVYIQGYLVQNLGDEEYVFRDDSGTVNIEIDDDLLAPNTVSPDALVWIAAEVDKDGNVVELDAEEIQFVNATQAANNAPAAK